MGVLKIISFFTRKNNIKVSPFQIEFVRANLISASARKAMQQCALEWGKTVILEYVCFLVAM